MDYIKSMKAVSGPYDVDVDVIIEGSVTTQESYYIKLVIDGEVVITNFITSTDGRRALELLGVKVAAVEKKVEIVEKQDEAPAMPVVVEPAPATLIAADANETIVEADTDDDPPF